MEVKIEILKVMVVDGKKVGKSLTFPMSPEAMVRYKTKAKVVKMIKEYAVKVGVFEEGELEGEDVVIKMDEFLEEWRKEVRKQGNK